MRQAEPTEDRRAVFPGTPGGRFTPLTDSECQSVYDAALDLLETHGMGSPIAEFVDVVTAAGGRVEGDRLLYPRRVVEGAIGAAAKEWIWHGLDESRSIELKDQLVHFGTAGAAVLMLDHDTNDYRPSTLADLYDISRLVDTLDNIHFLVRPVVTRDMETARDLDVNTAYAAMMGTTKPTGTSFFQPENVFEVVEMFDAVLGGPGEFRKRPFVVANNTFVVPPLRYAEESAQCMVAQVQAGMPINLLSAGQAGATSPAALAGSLVQALAECLAALTNVNLMVPGHPCVMGLWPFVSDLRTGAMTGGSGEEGLLNAAAAQVANWLGLPSGVAAGMADSKLPDNQAGYEKGVTVTLAAHAGANLIYESAGMLGSLLGCSLEALVIDNDMMGSINRTVRGIDINEAALSADVIAEVIHGAGHFLGHQQTLDLMQTEYTYPVIGDRQSPDDWRDAGAKNAREAAHEVVVDTLARHYPSHIPKAVDDAIRANHTIHLPQPPTLV
jgi:trimethylamine--corrinoid protein Co-methyltransferase